MKSYEEMAENVLRRGNEIIKKKAARRKTITRVISTLSCFCMVIIIGISIHKSGLPNVDIPTVQQGQTVATTADSTTIKTENYKYKTETVTGSVSSESLDTARKNLSAKVVQKDEIDNLEQVQDSIKNSNTESNNAEVSFDAASLPKNESFTGITKEQAKANARAKLSQQEIETITNLDNPKIEEIVFEGNLPIYLFDENTDIAGKDLYKITYNTEQDGLLGPIIFYADRISGNVVGCDFRE